LFSSKKSLFKNDRWNGHLAIKRTLIDEKGHCREKMATSIQFFFFSISISFISNVCKAICLIVHIVAVMENIKLIIKNQKIDKGKKNYSIAK